MIKDLEVIQVAILPEPEVRPDVILDPEDRHTEGVDSPRVEAPGSPEDAPPALQEPFEAIEPKGEKA